MNTSGNPILDKNLECIGKYNPKLVQDILNLPCLTNSIELTETDLKEPNLNYNFLPLHSSTGAEIEANKSLAKQQILHRHFTLYLAWDLDICSKNAAIFQKEKSFYTNLIWKF